MSSGNIKILIVSTLLVSSVNADNNTTCSKSFLSNAPLQNELSQVYKKGEEVGKKAGKNTKSFFCTELHWNFFCK
jgi:hypothetical protein